jgi:hypothetical protein
MFVRLAIASSERLPASDIQNVLADVCQRGYADRAAIWNELTPSEQTAYRALLAAEFPNSPQKI